MRFPADTCARRARASELATGSARDFYMRNKSIADTHRANGVAELRERQRTRSRDIFFVYSDAAPHDVVSVCNILNANHSRGLYKLNDLSLVLERVFLISFLFARSRVGNCEKLEYGEK